MHPILRWPASKISTISIRPHPIELAPDGRVDGDDPAGPGVGDPSSL
jgi:hypothetical protein